MINELPDYLEVPVDYVPEFLTSEERLVWLRAMPQLIQEGILTTIDLTLAEMYCVMVVKLQELLKENPSHYMVDKYRNHVQRMERELCLTPASYAAWIKTQLSIKDKRERQAKRDKQAVDFRPAGKQLALRKYFKQ